MKTLLAMFFFVAMAWDANAAEIGPADDRIQLIGRWHKFGEQPPWCAWQGSTIKVRFRGTRLRASIDSGNQVEYVRVIVDGDAMDSKKHKLSAGKHTYEFVSGLALEEHEVEIVKETYTGNGRMTLLGFECDGEVIAPKKRKPRLLIQFYGDSNLAGHSLEHEKNRGGAEFTGCHFTFAGIASRMLDADYQNISVGGAVIAGRLNSLMSFYDRVDYYQATPRWNFEDFPADVCVVNIGANDINSKSKERIKRDYKTLIAALRKAHPNAPIVLMNGYGWSRNEPANYTSEVVKEIADDKISTLRFPWLFNEWHGCEYDHAGMAVDLVNHLSTLNPDWKRVRGIDVVDGFGRGGDVANGSFEKSAPFGGYGWRYFQDGAERVHDPRGSADGEWYLRLPEGKQVHQPNPVQQGHRYTYRVKMRGKTVNDRAKIRIEFRDQKWRNEIPDTAREFSFTPGLNWSEFSATVEPPAGPSAGDPSRGPWQIILRLVSDSGTIDVDDIRLKSSFVVRQEFGDG